MRPYGLFGGRAGKPGESMLHPDGNPRRVTSKITMEAKKGDVFRYVLAGGGGWGDPLERDPLAVLRDVRNELVSQRSARDEYGIIVDMQAWTVDGPATEARRAELRAARKTPIPDVVWDDDGSPTPFPDRAEPGR